MKTKANKQKARVGEMMTLGLTVLVALPEDQGLFPSSSQPTVTLVSGIQYHLLTSADSALTWYMAYIQVS